ncbi:unnamed protein product, partial [Didymodactylos carnosus]
MGEAKRLKRLTKINVYLIFKFTQPLIVAYTPFDRGLSEIHKVIKEEETNLNNHDQTEDEIILNALLSLPDLETRADNLQTLAHSLFAVKSPKSQANYRRNRKRFISVGAIVIG